MAHDAIKAVDVLVKDLKYGELQVRQVAAEELGKVGLDIMTVLIQALDDKEPRVRSSAARALGLIAPTQDNAVKALLKALTDKDPKVYRSALNALDEFIGRS